MPGPSMNPERIVRGTGSVPRCARSRYDMATSGSEPRSRTVVSPTTSSITPSIDGSSRKNVAVHVPKAGDDRLAGGVDDRGALGTGVESAGPTATMRSPRMITFVFAG